MIEEVLSWARENQTALIVSGSVTAGFLLVSMIAIPLVALSLPPDYFTHERRPAGRLDGLSPGARTALKVGKNVLGVLLVAGGVAMLVLPGQGLLAILLGLLLIDFPGRYRLMKKLVRRKAVHKPLNWIRRKGGKEELQIEGAGEGSQGDRQGQPA